MPSTVTLVYCVLLAALPRQTLAREAPAAEQAEHSDRRPCSDPNSKVLDNSVRIWELRNPDRLDEDLLFTDGLDFQRDIGVFVCRGASYKKYVVRAWVRPKDGQWREIRIDEKTETQKKENLTNRTDPENTPYHPAILEVDLGRQATDGELTHVTIPIRREGLRIGDNVRVEVRTDCTADDEDPQCGREVVKEFLTVDRYGLLVGFSDSILFVKRLGIGSNAVAMGIDAANYRPSPGFNFGLTYLHRKHVFLQFLEPGFGFNVSLVDWKDTAPGIAAQTAGSTEEPIQVTVGAMGSMFDNVITVVYGWNTNVARDRSFVGVGFSVIGAVRKVMRSSH